jgi:hypothetical protein
MVAVIALARGLTSVGFGLAVLLAGSPVAAALAVPPVPSVPIPTLPTLPTLPLPIAPPEVTVPVVPVPVIPPPTDVVAVPPLSTASVLFGLGGLSPSIPLAADAVPELGSAPAVTPDQQALSEPTLVPVSGAAPSSPFSTARLPQAGASNPDGTRCFIATTGGIASAHECREAARQRKASAPGRTASATAQVRVLGISLARTGANILAVVAAGLVLLLVGLSLIWLRRRLGSAKLVGEGIQEPT